MKILIRNSDNAVLFADDSLQLTDTGASGNGWIANFVNSTNSRLEDSTLPADWVGAAYSYDGTWTVIDQAAIDAAKPSLTVQQIIDAMTDLFDKTAQARRYDNRVTCALRAGYPGPFQEEGQAFAMWMDECNYIGYQMLAKVMSGQMPMPSTVEDALALLPAMVWP